MPKGNFGAPQKGLEHSKPLSQLSSLATALEARAHTFEWDNLEDSNFHENMTTLWKPSKISVRISGLSSLLSTLLLCSSNAEEWPENYIDEIVRLLKHVLKGECKPISSSNNSSKKRGKKKKKSLGTSGKRNIKDDDTTEEQIIALQLTSAIAFLFGDNTRWSLFKTLIGILTSHSKPQKLRIAAAEFFPLFAAAAVGVVTGIRVNVEGGIIDDVNDKVNNNNNNHHHHDDVTYSAFENALQFGSSDKSHLSSPLSSAINILLDQVREINYSKNLRVILPFKKSLLKALSSVIGLTCLERDSLIVYDFIDNELEYIINLLETEHDVDVRITLGYILCLIYEINNNFLMEGEEYELDSKMEHSLLESCRVLYDDTSRDHSLTRKDRTRQHKIFHQITCFLEGRNYHLGSREAAEEAHKYLRDNDSDIGFEHIDRRGEYVTDTPTIVSGDLWLNIFGLDDRGEHCCTQISVEYLKTFLTLTCLERDDYAYIDSRFLQRAQKLVSQIRTP